MSNEINVCLQSNVNRTYRVLKPANEIEASNIAFSNAQNIQYSLAKEIASDSQLNQAQNEFNRDVATGVGVFGGAACVGGLVGALCFAAGPVGWTIAGIGALLGIGGVGFAVDSNNKAQNSKQDKNGAIDYANNADPGADKHLNIDEGYIVKDLDKEIVSDKVDDFIQEGKLESDKITYLSISDSVGDGFDVIYGKYDVDVREFDSKLKLDGNGKEYNGFETKEVAIPKEFKTFSETLLNEELNEEKVENIDNIIENIHNGKFSYIDVNNDGYINDYDRYALEKLIKGVTVEDISSKLGKELKTDEQEKYDINGDGYFNQDDVTYYADLLENQYERADLNKDGVINEKDLALLVQYETAIADYYRGLAKKTENVEKNVGKEGKLNGKTLEEIVN